MPWMNSAPSSTASRPSGAAVQRTRPPMRSRASSTIARSDRRASADAAVSPAAPAPITTTSASNHHHRRRCWMPKARGPARAGPLLLDRPMPASAAVRHGPLMTHPPEPWLKALSHSDWTAKVPVLSVMFCDAPGPLEIHAHLSPFSAPLASTQPLDGTGSVCVSASSWPETIVMPAFGPRPLKLAPHDAPASVMYGMFVNATSPDDDDSALCHAQNC